MIVLLSRGNSSSVAIRTVAGNLPIHCASASGHLAAVKLLASLMFKCSCDIEVQNNAGERARDVAKKHRHKNVSRFFSSLKTVGS